MDWRLEMFSLPQAIEDSRQFFFCEQIFYRKLTLGAPEIYRYMVCGRRSPSVEFKVCTDVTVIMCMHMIIVPFTTTRNSGTQVLYSKLY